MLAQQCKDPGFEHVRVPHGTRGFANRLHGFEKTASFLLLARQESGANGFKPARACSQVVDHPLRGSGGHILKRIAQLANRLPYFSEYQLHLLEA